MKIEVLQPETEFKPIEIKLVITTEQELLSLFHQLDFKQELDYWHPNRKKPEGFNQIIKELRDSVKRLAMTHCTKLSSILNFAPS